VRRLRLLAVLVPLLAATGCGFRPEPIGSLPSFPEAVTDGIGRHVTMESQPRRVVSLDPGLTESAFAVGAGPLVVAGSGREQYPAAALRLPPAAGAGKTPSVARLRKLHPDLVLMPNGMSASLTAPSADEASAVAATMVRSSRGPARPIVRNAMTPKTHRRSGFETLGAKQDMP